MNIFSKLLDIIFPNKCINCFVYTHNQQLLCSNCFKQININTNFICFKCHTNIKITEIHCSDTNLNSILCCLDYQNQLVKELIHNFKYQKLKSLQNIFEQILNISLENYKEYFNENEYIIIPVPLHPLKQRIRGFNQSEILSNSISKILNLKSYNNILIRFKNNSPQANQTDISKRKENAKNIFKINENLKHLINNKNIILVDDVFTTGSTLNECAKILKQNNANTIISICLAR